MIIRFLASSALWIILGVNLIAMGWSREQLIPCMIGSFSLGVGLAGFKWEIITTMEDRNRV